MKNNNIMELNYYYPYCKQICCDGVLQIKINDDFTVDYECDKNKNHKGERIFFKVFERFYLKEKSIDKCSNSNCKYILDTNNIFKCKKCDNIYCSNCFLLDKHIRNDINNLILQSQKCQIHNIEFTQFCINCNKYLCIFCAKDIDKKISHKNHSIKNLLDFMPSINNINSLNDKVKQKAKYNEELINIIDEWEKTIIKKAEQYKNYLKNEIDFYKKIFINFNQYFKNYTYYSNFYYLDNYLKEINFDLINNIKNLNEFKEKTNAIIELFNTKKKEDKIEIKKANIKRYYTINEGILMKLNDKYFFDYSINRKSVHLSLYDEEKDIMQYMRQSSIEFNYTIFSVSFSKEKNQIYACLL